MSRTRLLLGVGGLALATGLVAAVATTPLLDRFRLATIGDTHATPATGPTPAVGVGPLLDGARLPYGERAALLAAAEMRAKTVLPGAPEALHDLATALALDAAIAPSTWTSMDPLLFGRVFAPTGSWADGGGSLAREAIALGRMDALAAMAEAGLPTAHDGDALFWGALELWDAGQAGDGRRVLAVAAKEHRGVDRIHEEGFTAFEMAASVDLDAVAALVETGGNPWNHPADPDGALSIPGLMERLALHHDSPGALEILDALARMDGLPAPREQVLWNTVGNLAEGAGASLAAGDHRVATHAAQVARRLESRFGDAPPSFWPAEVAALGTMAPPTRVPLVLDSDLPIEHGATEGGLVGVGNPIGTKGDAEGQQDHPRGMDRQEETDVSGDGASFELDRFDLDKGLQNKSR